MIMEFAYVSDGAQASFFRIASSSVAHPAVGVTASLLVSPERERIAPRLMPTAFARKVTTVALFLFEVFKSRSAAFASYSIGSVNGAVKRRLESENM